MGHALIMQLLLIACKLMSVAVSAPVSSREEMEVVEGDMLNFDPKLLAGSSYKSALLAREYLWDEGIMYYRFDPGMDIETRKLIRSAMKNIEMHSCVRFVRYDDGMEVDDWYVLEPAPDARKGLCASTVGLICKNATLNCSHKMIIGKNCRLGHLVHELMHSLGFVHEHTRSDRDQYIKILVDNIEGGEEYRQNFAPYIFPLRILTPYDYESIMHYGPDAFSDPKKNYEPTIVALKPLSDGVMGQRDRFSRLDIEKLNKLYDCHKRR